MTSLVIAHGLTLDQRLSPTDFSSAGGEFVALVGPNGGGKTSLLRALARVEDAGGSVSIDGEELDGAGENRRRRLVGLLPASREVAWPISVRDVIALGLGSRDDARVDEMISAFALEPLAARSIGAISTGERTRALMARALAAKPKLLLLDEPLANLDPYWVLRTLELLRAAAHEGATVMMALHDLAQVGAFDRLLLLKDGKIVADGAPLPLTDQLGALFGVVATPAGWRLNPTGDRQSSP